MKKFINKITNEIEEANSFTKEFAFSNNSNYEVFEEISQVYENDNLEDNDIENNNNIDEDNLEDNDNSDNKKIKGKKLKNKVGDK